uniref:Chemokine (C-X-C motif) receptor 4a n=1 Tax=Scophthalmus maximus TaxID=52904 RepID=A0A8D3AN68_SCOMX
MSYYEHILLDYDSNDTGSGSGSGSGELGMDLQEPCQVEHVMTSELQQVFLPVVYALIFTLGITGNGLVVFVLGCQRRSKCSLTDRYRLHLSAADLLFVLALPFWAVDAALNDWRFGPATCIGVQVIYTVNLYGSVLILAFISLDRYLAVVRATDTNTGGLRQLLAHRLVYVGECGKMDSLNPLLSSLLPSSPLLSSLLPSSPLLSSFLLSSSLLSSPPLFLLLSSLSLLLLLSLPPPPFLLLSFPSLPSSSSSSLSSSLLSSLPPPPPPLLSSPPSSSSLSPPLLSSLSPLLLLLPSSLLPSSRLFSSPLLSYLHTVHDVFFMSSSLRCLVACWSVGSARHDICQDSGRRRGGHSVSAVLPSRQCSSLGGSVPPAAGPRGSGDPRPSAAGVLLRHRHQADPGPAGGPAAEAASGQDHHRVGALLLRVLAALWGGHLRGRPAAPGGPAPQLQPGGCPWRVAGGG